MVKKNQFLFAHQKIHLGQPRVMNQPEGTCFSILNRETLRIVTLEKHCRLLPLTSKDANNPTTSFFINKNQTINTTILYLHYNFYVFFFYISICHAVYLPFIFKSFNSFNLSILSKIFDRYNRDPIIIHDNHKKFNRSQSSIMALTNKCTEQNQQ